MRENGLLALVASNGSAEYTAVYPHSFPAVAASVTDGERDDPDTRRIEADAPLPVAARAIDRLVNDPPSGHARLTGRFTVLCAEAWSEVSGGTGGELEMGLGSGPTVAALTMTGIDRPGGPYYESRGLSRAFPTVIKGWWARGPAPDWSDTDEELVAQVERLIARFRRVPVPTVRRELVDGKPGAVAFTHWRRPDETQWMFVCRGVDGRAHIGRPAEYRMGIGFQRAPFGLQLREKRAAIVGCGALGWSVALSLARAGVGHLVLFDGDVVNSSNLPRLAARIGWVGESKVKALAAEIREAAPETTAAAINAFVGAELGAKALIHEKPDLIVDATADPRSPAETNLAALALGKPGLYAWTSSGVVAARLFRVVPGRTPCYECLSQARIPPIKADRAINGWSEQFVWNGANFNLDMVAAAATRIAVRTLLGDAVTPDNPDHVVLDLGGPTPRVRALRYDRDPQCDVCS